jgi:hypothetical protein
LDERDEVTGEWRNLHSEVFHILYSSPNIIGMRRAGHVVRVGEKRKVYEVLVGKLEGKRVTWKTKT